MRVTRIPGDFNDIGERPCRVYCNEVEIQGWTVADDFRRVVETPGKVHHGAVRIDLAKGVRIPDDAVLEIGGKIVTREPVPEVAAAQNKPNKPVEPNKPSIHIPARKRKAGK
jgi:hypothetical protein